jgi:hypothetical protein
MNNRIKATIARLVEVEAEFLTEQRAEKIAGNVVKEAQAKGALHGIRCALAVLRHDFPECGENHKPYEWPDGAAGESDHGLAGRRHD